MEGRGRVMTLETFIIDTFTRVDQDGVEHAVDQPDQIGGGGTYAILGARIWLPPSRLGMIVDHTPDTLPDSMRAALTHYGDEMWDFRIRDDGEPTCKAVNRYTDNLRVFEYLSPARYISPSDVIETPGPLPAAIHFISELRFLDSHMEEIRDYRTRFPEWEPRLVYEPLPYDCVPDRLEGVKRIAGQVDILTPNHTEALSLLSIPPPSVEKLRSALEDAARQLAAWGPKFGVVIRAGALGAAYLDTAPPAPPSGSSSREVKWVPAYWALDDPDSRSRVVDPTGAGNAFCGALAAALADNLPLKEAVLRGSVAASFMIEQHGLPCLTKKRGEELWNGERPIDRLDKLRSRLGCPL